jgi:hypothetical protein
VGENTLHLFYYYYHRHYPSAVYIASTL